ncbi:MAG TPA: hypothetical protein VFE31_16900 [Opitutaceae bacterium]|jgi:hypothetical protein|nr:hypothetical protein [Opitutaceae bacterium]
MRLLDIARLLLRLGGLSALAISVADASFYRADAPRFWQHFSPEAYSHIALNLLVAAILLGATDTVLALFLGRSRSAPLDELKAVELGVVVARMAAFWFLVTALSYARLVPGYVRAYPNELPQFQLVAAELRPVLYLLLACALFFKPTRIMGIFAPPPGAP